MDEPTTSEPRAKRQKKDKSGRLAALEKLRSLKGSKYKYEITELENVYDTVEEKEYMKRTLDQQDDWIVNDNGSGYIEDGRDIFDDDWDTESTAAASKEKSSKNKKKGVSDISAGKGNLQYLLSNMPTKKKEDKKLDEDDLLSELISELNDENSAVSDNYKTPKKTVIKPKPISTFSLSAKKQAAKDYMKTFSVTKSNSNEKKIDPQIELSTNVNSITQKPSVKLFCEVQQNVTKSNSKEKKVELQNELQTNVNSVIQKPSEKLFHEIQQDVVKDKDIIPSSNLHISDTNENAEKGSTPSQDIEIVESQPSLDVKRTESQNIEDFTSQANLLDDDFDINQLEDLDMTPAKSPINEDQLLSGWETVQENVCNKIQIGVDIDTSKLPIVTNDDGNKVFRFFWWDAFEELRKQPGVVFLFGKVYSDIAKAFVSCCVAVRNIERKIYFLPKTHTEEGKPVSLIDVYHEINKDIADEIGLDSFKSRKVTKNYCFDPEVPAQSEYLEVRYSARKSPLEASRKGKTFSKVFGTNSSFLEVLLLERKIKGPCWLDITNPEPVNNPISWCKFEINCNKLADISVVQTSNTLPPPPLVVAAINLRTVVNPKTLANEIVMISCFIHNEYYVNKQAPKTTFQHFCVFTRPSDQPLPIDMYEALQNYRATKVQKMDSERALLNYFINQFFNLDPDLIVGHDLLGYHISVLQDRICSHKLMTFSKLSKLKRTILPTKMKTEQQLFTGRLVCDIKISAKELIKSRSFDLETLCQTVLKLKEGQRIEIEPEDVQRLYQNSADLLKLISLTMQDTAYILKMMYELNVIPLALQITNIAGNVMSRTLLGGRSERNEFLLLHAFSEKDYIVPNKNFFKKSETVDDEDAGKPKSSRKKPTYSGGLVLEPKVGFYDKLILLMDFNSLYPSIIQEYNICFTTIAGTSEDNLVLPDQNLPPGILPTEIRKLVESRREVKKLMNNPDLSHDLRMQYNIRQMALKLTANSMYGCLGFTNSRFYAKSLAALVTHKGREILTNTRDIVQKMSHEVIYGDTDSIMINSNCLDYDQVIKIGLKIKQEINKLYRQVELDIDGVFKYLLLLKKKKYAAVTLTKSKTGELVCTQEYKGLDIVRRDWSQLAAEAGKFILNCILSEQSSEERIENIHAHLRKLREDLEENRVPLPLLVITKQLTKDPKMYADKQQLPHVQVALRYNQKGGKTLKAGDTVPYVICDDSSNLPATQRAYHVDELKNSETLKIDIKYYLAQQIHPVVSRLCEPIEGTDAYEIANCLGIDTTSFKKPKDNNSNITGENPKSKEIIFRHVDPFIFKCMSCKSENVIKSTLVDKMTFLEGCQNSDCNVRPIEYLPSIQNQLMLCIRKFIIKYYKNEIMCEDPACPNETVQMPLRFASKYPVCTLCKKGVMYKKYSEGDLYNQLLYYQHIFDLNKLEKKKLLEGSVEAGFHTLRETVEKYLRHSGYSIINLTELFSGLFTKRNDVLETEEIEEVQEDDLVLEEESF